MVSERKIPKTTPKNPNLLKAGLILFVPFNFTQPNVYGVQTGNYYQTVMFKYSIPQNFSSLNLVEYV